ncbi:MAG: 2-isopropylmalate synthase [Spirochaetia bacterium]|nr:2-isopropylmalate synthase [Spirochaetota bacterium]MCX8095906.1 2-isopropylmalate synthase [Spirochaetota bacterium]MDW8112258.1 2-isopropylmalate synthase [Spirochaetia bacterium]
MDKKVKWSQFSGLRLRKEYETDYTKQEYYKDIFPYNEPPIIEFDNLIPPQHIPDEIWVTDTTFRDGQQARDPYTVKQTVDIYNLLVRLDNGSGIIKETEFFLYTHKDKEAVSKCMELNASYPRITGWVRANEKEIHIPIGMGIKKTGILTSVSDYHIYRKLNLDRKKAEEMYLSVVRKAAEIGYSEVRCHFEDITRADIFGFVIPFAQKLMKIMDDSGMKITIRICDTMGYGVPFPTASLPRGIPKLIYYLREEAGVPSELLEMHMHNDFGVVIANSVAGWLYGASSINASLLGTGERTGNTPLEQTIFWYYAIKGNVKKMNLRVITEIKEYYEKEIGEKIDAQKPFVGEYFNVTRAGIHADGLMKDPEIYNIFDTEKILGRKPQVIITDKSGSAGVAYWINAFFNLENSNRLSKDHKGVKAIYEEIVKMYEEGKTGSVKTEEMIRLVKKYLPELVKE